MLLMWLTYNCEYQLFLVLLCLWITFTFGSAVNVHMLIAKSITEQWEKTGSALKAAATGGHAYSRMRYWC